MRFFCIEFTLVIHFKVRNIAFILWKYFQGALIDEEFHQYNNAT